MGNLARPCLPADGVDADVVGVVDAVVGNEEIGDVPVHRDRLALARTSVLDRVAFGDDVLNGSCGAIAVGEDGDPVGTDAAVAAAAPRRAMESARLAIRLTVLSRR